MSLSLRFASPLSEHVNSLEDALLGPLPLLDVAWAMFVAQSLRTSGCGSLNQPWFQALLAFLFTSLAGTSLTSVVWLGTTPGWLLSNSCFATYIVVFFAHRFCPGDALFNLLAVAPVALVVKFFVDVSWAWSITSWGLERALTVPSKSAPLAFVCGFTSGCGGGLLCDAFGFSEKQWGVRTPDAIRGPSQGVQLTIALTVAFYMLINPHRLFDYDPLFSVADARVVIFMAIFAVESVPAWLALIGVGGASKNRQKKKKQA
jgi:hypothetical protein